MPRFFATYKHFTPNGVKSSNAQGAGLLSPLLFLNFHLLI